MTQKFGAILTGPDTHLDHLAPLCYIMAMPLLVTDKTTYELALTFYPQIQIMYTPLEDLTALFLVKNFDVLFESGKCFSMNLEPVIKLLYQKKIRFIYSPHGHSDKGHSAKTFASQDISLVYGNHMLDLLRNSGALEKIGAIIRTGNYRFPFYQKHKSFYDSLVKDQISCHFNPFKQTILYAPSWQDGENPTSFFTYAEKLIQDLSNDFNLIIKLHPLLSEFHPAETFSIIERHKKNINCFFLDTFPAIYPLLAISDIYIGDYSSIGYDFLVFNKPLYFLTEKHSPSFAIHACGLEIQSQENMSSFIHQSLEMNRKEKDQKRKETYTYAFGEEIAFERLREEIIETTFN